MTRKVEMFLAGFAAVTILTACQISDPAQAASPQTSPAPSAQLPWSKAGSYLAVRFANAQGDWEKAAELDALARKASPNNPELLVAGMVANVHTGNYLEAVKLAKDLNKKAPDAQLPMLYLLLATDAVKQGDFATAQKMVDKIPMKGDSQYVLPLLKAWIAYGAGDNEKAKNILENGAKLQGFGSVMALHRALQLELGKGDKGAIDGNFKSALSAENQLQPRWLELYVGFLSRNNKSEAETLLQKIIDKSGGNGQGHFAVELKARINKGILKPEITDAKSGLAQGFFELSWLFARQNLVKDASLFAQMSLALNPKSDATILLVGDVKRAAKNWPAAEKAYQQVEKNSLYRADAKLALAETLNSADRFDEAVALLKKTSGEFPQLSDAPALLGDIYRSEKKWEEAIASYSAAISLKKEKFVASDWGLFYYRGTAYERNKQWPEAEKDFLKALDLKPDEPYVLNYLAYSWTERKENLARAVEMLEKAAELRPEDGFIIDSLGWAYFQLGNVEKAVPLLERAVELSPNDPTLNDHLGDAYWHAGRQAEARYQWKKALVNKPEPDQVSAIEDKIKNGIVIVKSGG